MSVNAMRALVLLANLLLVGLIVWLCHDTFVALDLERYEVRPPNQKNLEIPDRGPDPRGRDKQLYLAIGRAFDPPPIKVEVAPPPKIDTTPVKPNPKEIKVVAVNYAENQELASALLSPPGASEPRFMQVGLDLGQIAGYGFDNYKGWKIKAITPSGEVIVVDEQGNEVRLEGPKPISHSSSGERR